MKQLHLDKTTTDGDKYFIIHKYSSEDVKKLHKMGELAHFKLNNESYFGNGYNITSLMNSISNNSDNFTQFNN